jgi:hypothetical protein
MCQYVPESREFDGKIAASNFCINTWSLPTLFGAGLGKSRKADLRSASNTRI